MMEDKTIKIISLTMALVGIIGLAVISLQSGYTPTNIYEISESMIGKKVVVNGTIRSLSIKENNLFMSLEDSGIIKIVMFNSDIRANAGNRAVVYGRVNVYKNELEIVAEKIIVGDS